MNAENVRTLREMRRNVDVLFGCAEGDAKRAALDAAIAALSAEGGAVAWQERHLQQIGKWGPWRECSKAYFDVYNQDDGLLYEVRELFARPMPAAAATGDMVLVPREPTPAALKQLMSGEQRHRFNNGSKDVREEVLVHVRANFADFLAAQQEPAP